MKKKILAILLAFVFVFTQTNLTEAKARAGSSKSSSTRSVGGYSGSSSSKSSSGTSKSTGSYSGSSTSGSSSSSSRSVPGSYSTGSSSGSSSSKSSGYTGSAQSASKGGSTSKTDTRKSSYMNEQYKKQSSSSNYSSYKQKLNDEQKSTYESSFNRSYGSGSRMNFDDAMSSRSQRMNSFGNRPIFVNVNPTYFGGPFSYGYGFAGAWDMWFLMRASEMFWYHHWSEISPYRNYFDQAQFAQMENRIKQLEAQNIARDPAYMEPGVDPDIQLSGEYVEKNLDSVYYTDKYSKPAGSPILTIVIAAVVIVALLFIIRRLTRRRPKGNIGSGGIY